MNLSIAIVNWNTKDYLERCLTSLLANPPSCEFEIIVVDNASCDGSADLVAANFDQVILIRNRENLGYAHANNQAIEISRGNYILLLNPDTEVKKGALDALLTFAERHPEAAAVGCRLVHPDGRIQRSVRSFPTPAAIFFEYTKLSRLFPGSKLFGRYRMTYFDYSSEAEVDQPMGSCLLLARRAVEDVGLFDERFPIFFNEVDWCYRAKEKGWKIYFTPDAEIIHHGGASTRQVRADMIRESHESLAKFYAKHYRGRICAPIYWAIITAIKINSFLAVRTKSRGKHRD